MKTVRFSKVVEKAGSPEVYLLLSETDPEFEKALKANRILSLSNESHGSRAEFGRVGYDKRRSGQLLVFPRSLKTFEDKKIVGIKYDLFAQMEEAPRERNSAPAERPSSGSQGDAKKRLAITRSNSNQAESERTVTKRTLKPAEKVIQFPGSQKEKAFCPPEINVSIRKALSALEKGNSVAAYKILSGLL